LALGRGRLSAGLHRLGRLSFSESGGLLSGVRLYGLGNLVHFFLKALQRLSYSLSNLWQLPCPEND
jgi:hypothetical protein